MQVRVATPPASAVSSESNEQKVYDYIVSHNGTISFSKAAQDLEMSSESLRIAIEHLKSAGLLDQT